jgi:Zn-dependent membrane protease YugP
MPPEKQQAIGEEIAERLLDKAKLAQVETDQRNGEITSQL